ncbi:MAG: CsbD family protein [Thermomicrobiales bacterium]
MSDADKDRLAGIGDKVSGNVKEGVGKVTGDKQTEGEGKAEQVVGDVKEGLADLKDKVSDTVKKITD